MWPIIINAVRVYAPYVVWPVAAVIGFIGYNLETGVRGEEGMNTPAKSHSIIEEREERRLQEIKETDPTKVDGLKEKQFVPRSVFPPLRKAEDKKE